jgi:Lon protease-like protein
MEIGLFPLELVLFPTERVPLHIFEDRYKELIGECLREQREFGLVLEDADGLRAIGTRASVVEVTELFDDGRLNVVVEGGERFVLVAETGGRSFRTGEVEPLPDEAGEEPAAAAAERARALLAEVAAVAETPVELPPVESPHLSWELGARIDFGAAVKQELLELRSEPARLARLVELLQQALGALRLEREVRERAGRNGKVSPR